MEKNVGNATVVPPTGKSESTSHNSSGMHVSMQLKGIHDFEIERDETVNMWTITGYLHAVCVFGRFTSASSVWSSQLSPTHDATDGAE